MKLSAILSVATLLPLILAIATPQVDDQCDSKCQPVENELNRCKALTPVEVPNCVCKSSVINSNLDACAKCSNTKENNLAEEYKKICNQAGFHIPGTSSKTRVGYFILGGMAAAAGVAAIL